ncbi:MAG: hypothetical protein HW421_4043 [Ignavibacteria bacterium]|nr:hypothetical protein [Ignavibacteria bacterium]
MKETFLERAKENIKAAELLFENGLYNASANRAYYAAFHIAIASIFASGIIPNIDHKTVQTLFSDYFFNKRKILPSNYKRYLKDLQDKRNIADYKTGVSKKTAKNQLNDAKEFVELILGVIT